jgi:MYXO-CTERM domain-containing protein
VWRDDTVCGSNQQCVSGKCHDLCSPDEFEMCPAGQICTGVTEGRFCFPTDMDGGVGGGGGSGAGGGGGSTGGGSASGGGSGTSGVVEEPRGSGRIGASAMGCQCGAVDPAMFPLLGLVVLALRRRRG